MAVLTIKGLSKSYGKITALENLNLEIEAGKVYGLLGPNGSGKTTTLGIILGILKADTGSYEWFDGKYGPYHRKKIGAILETPNFYPYKNAVDNLKIISHIKGIKQDNYDHVLDLVNLSHRKLSAFRTYSLGMKQRLAIAATMIGEPEVVIFDEPTNGLDPQGISEVRQTLTQIADSGKTVILASHILDEVEKICSDVAIIKNGVMLATGPVGSILSSDVFIELKAENMDELNRMLNDLNWIKDLRVDKGMLQGTMDPAHSISEINRMAFDHDITLTHMVARKQRLEEEFLQITK